MGPTSLARRSGGQPEEVIDPLGESRVSTAKPTGSPGRHEGLRDAADEQGHLAIDDGRALLGFLVLVLRRRGVQLSPVS